MKAITSIEDDCRQEVYEKGLGVEGYEEADLPAVVVQIAPDDKAEENGGNRFRKHVKLRKQQGMSEEQ